MLYNKNMLGDIIKELRKEKGITQKTLAIALNITTQAVSLWEKDKADPDLINIKLLANYFNVSTDYLLGLEDESGRKIEQNIIFGNNSNYINGNNNITINSKNFLS